MGICVEQTAPEVNAKEKVMYTSWELVRKRNLEKYGINFPQQPEDYREKAGEEISTLERESIGFVRELCKELRFDKSDKEKAACEDRKGNAISPGLIPYNMEKDNDRLCLERAIHHFMKSGTAQDAFDIYFCYLELFVGQYGKSKKMIELLAEFEMNASSLLMKHRDHYSHSAYVFLLGLAIYKNADHFRAVYRKHFGLDGAEQEQEAAHHFLKYWGMASLFHDIGYPFELPFEQVKSYYGDSIEDVPFVAYKGVDEYVKLPKEYQKTWAEVLGARGKFTDLNELFAWGINHCLGEKYGDFNAKILLDAKPGSPDKFGGYMDHAYFSGVLLYHQLAKVLGVEAMTKDAATAMAYLDTFTAISLHNSLFKFGITNIKKPGNELPMELHPLAYMLMLCDELQCWDRTSYGQNSRQQLHPMNCEISFDETNKNIIIAKYQYDKHFEARKYRMQGTYAKMLPKDKNGKETIKFVEDIEEIIRLDGEQAIGLVLETEFAAEKRERKTYLSDSNYIHLYNFSIVVHGRNSYDEAKVGDPHFFAELEEKFNTKPLEYKMSVISRTKEYARYLNAIGYFYTDRNVDCKMLEADEFTEEDAAVIGKLEHERWSNEKLEMGWRFDDRYHTLNLEPEAEKRLRERTRTHYEIGVPYEELPESEKSKDKTPLQKMIKLLEEYDGIRIYEIPGRKQCE